MSFSKTFTVVNPSTLKVIAIVPSLELSKINSAIDNTVQTFSSWKQSLFETRIIILKNGII